MIARGLARQHPAQAPAHEVHGLAVALRQLADASTTTG